MMLNFLRGPDDERADRALQATRVADTALHATTGDCQRCGVIETLLIGTLCHVCEDEARWSRGNRAWCALLHRGGRHSATLEVD